MTAKPESVESVCELLAHDLPHSTGHDNDCRVCRILTAHRAELAEALKEPTQDEVRSVCAGGEEYVLAHQPVTAALLGHRRRKHGVDK